MLRDKYSLAELSASPLPPPATNSWQYTTSTAPPTTVDGTKSTKSTTLDQSSTHVLVVIFMATE